MRDMLIVGTIVAIIGGGIWYEYSMWSECRATNSWLYCVRVLGY